MLGTVVSLFQFKQFVWLAAPLLTLTVWSLLHLPRPATVLGLALLVLGAGASQTYQMVTLTKDDWRGAAAYLEMQLQPQDRLYANPAASHLALDLYTSQPLPLSGYPPAYHIVTGGWDGERLTPALAAAQLAPLATQAQRVWLIEFYPEFWDPQAALSQWLAAHGRLVDDQWFGQVHLRRYDLEPTP
jgi:hypothetical protein